MKIATPAAWVPILSKNRKRRTSHSSRLFIVRFAPKTVQKLVLSGILSSPLSHPIPAKSMIRRKK
jgi:hypothetical protein